MKLLLLTSYYPYFLKHFYKKNADFQNLTYEVMLDRLLSAFFADTGSMYYYSQQHGYQSFIIIENCEPLQKKWATENKVSFSEVNWKKEIVLAQIKQFHPDVFYIESIFEYYGSFLKEIRQYCKLIVSWISSPLPEHLDIQGVDLIVSSTMEYVSSFRNHGIASEYMLPAFDKRILQKFPKENKKDIEFSFVGGWSDVHVNRKQAIEKLIEQTPIQLWGYGYKPVYSKKSFQFYRNRILPYTSPLLKAYHGEAWGIDMFNILQRSLLTFNIHEDLLKGDVGNMRMFEATGVGTLILNDMGKNLSTLFVPGEEIEVYNSIPEAIEKVNYYLANPEKAISMGQKAQQRTLQDYNYDLYIQQFSTLIKRFI